MHVGPFSARVLSRPGCWFGLQHLYSIRIHDKKSAQASAETDFDAVYARLLSAPESVQRALSVTDRKRINRNKALPTRSRVTPADYSKHPASYFSAINDHPYYYPGGRSTARMIPCVISNLSSIFVHQLSTASTLKHEWPLAVHQLRSPSTRDTLVAHHFLTSPRTLASPASENFSLLEHDL
jgi:hypothetical protein